MKLSNGAAVEDDSAGVQALGDVRRVFKEMRRDRLHTESLSKSCAGFPESPWATWHHGKPLDPARPCEAAAPLWDSIQTTLGGR